MRLNARCSFLNSNPIQPPALLGSTTVSGPNGTGSCLLPNETVFASTGPSLRPFLTGILAALDGINGHVALKPAFGPNLLDVELLHYYTTVTCFSLSSRPSKQQIWQIAVPREAASHQFLLHALLSIAAVNLKYLHPTKRRFYERAASTHRNLALSTSIHALHEVTPSNCHALFALSCVVSVLAFAFPHREQLALPSTPVDDMLSVFVLIRGVKTVLHSAQEWIAHGALGALTGNDWDPTTSPLPGEMNSAFDKLSDRNERDTPDPSIREMYNSTIEGLKKAFEIHAVVRGESGFIFTWLVMVQASYVAQLEKKDPMALVILAHYAVLLHSSDGQWWIGGRGAQLLEAIYQTLPPEWLSAVEFPWEVVARGWDWTTGLIRVGPAPAKLESRERQRDDETWMQVQGFA